MLKTNGLIYYNMITSQFLQKLARLLLILLRYQGSDSNTQNIYAHLTLTVPVTTIDALRHFERG